MTREDLSDANWKDAEEFCKGAFRPFVLDVSQYVKIVAELMQHATDRALSGGVAQIASCTDLEISDEWEKRFSVTLDPEQCILAQGATDRAVLRDIIAKHQKCFMPCACLDNTQHSDCAALADAILAVSSTDGGTPSTLRINEREHL